MHKLSILLALGSIAPAWATDAAPPSADIHAAVSKALPLLQKGAAGHMAQRTCFACHNQHVPILALVTARNHGFAIDDAEVQKNLVFINAFLEKNRTNYLQGRGQGGQVDTAGYALWTLELGNWKGNETSAAVAEYFLRYQQDIDHWRATANRPPTEMSHFTASYLALRALHTFGIAEQDERIAARTRQVRAWLLRTPPRDTEDRVFRLWALKVAGAHPVEVQAAAQELLKTQRDDGGWSQLSTMESDAYATGTALVALNDAAGLRVHDPVYQRGVRFLLKTQLPDGSWHIRSRSKPFQLYYESGFPHGKDQFISIAASGWATTALALAAGAPQPPQTGKFLEYRPELITQLLTEAKSRGDVRRGANVFMAPQFACVSCHRVGKLGGSVGPDLTAVGKCIPPEQIVESILWPKRQVKEGFAALSVLTDDGKTHQGYKVSENDNDLVLRDPATEKPITVKKSSIEERREVGSLMPEGLAEAMTFEQRRDLVRFLLDLGKDDGGVDLVAAHRVEPATMPIIREPLEPKHWPSWQQPVNRNRLYDFYAREAEYFRKQPTMPMLLPAFPGLDGGSKGHWGNQNESTWKDGRWNDTDLGALQCGVFRGAGVTVPRGVCVRLGDKGEMSACFNPDTLAYDMIWQGGFVKFSDVRHGFMDGLIMDGKPIPLAPMGRGVGGEGRSFTYQGFYRHGKRVIFAYQQDGIDMLDAPWVENGKFTRVVAPAKDHPLAHLTRGGPVQWPQTIATKGTLGPGGPYVVDTITPPFENPWKALMFFGDHDFYADGTALICTMEGDVWRVDGLDDKLDNVRWRRVAAGLHQPLGLVIADKQVHVLGRNQITRLHDKNGDGEMDFYECFSNAYATSPAGHDFICGLQRDSQGNFYTASGNQGLLKISADGKHAEVIATGFRNPDGLGLLPDGSVTVPCSEGEWTPSSMICLVKPAPLSPLGRGDRGEGRSAKPQAAPVLHFGYGGPKDGKPPALPLAYLPRGLDNSSGGQVHVPSDRWGPLKDQLIHFSYGQGSHFLMLRDEIDGQPQGAVVPLVGEFLSGAHRGRFNPKDGQLYVSGMAGWGTYTDADGCFQRVRYTGQRAQLPTAFRVHENGVQVRFAQPIQRGVAEQVAHQFAQAWNYRYSASYGSPEFSPHHPGTKGHDPVRIMGAHVASDGRTLFLEIPDIQPVNQLHLRLRVEEGAAHDLIMTVHKLSAPYAAFPGYRPYPRTIAAHPILSDLAVVANSLPNPWAKPIPGARSISVEAGKNLTFATKTLKVKAGEKLRLTFNNPDVVPHNWVLLKPGTLEKVGLLVNQIIAEPDAAARQYVPKTDAVLAYTDIVQPLARSTIHFTAPRDKGRYPFLCTFPGHWMVMNGEMIVE